MKKVLCLVVLLVLAVGVCAADDVDPYLILTSKTGAESVLPFNGTAIFTGPNYANQNHNFYNNTGQDITWLTVTYTGGFSYTEPPYSDSTFVCNGGGSFPANLGTFTCSHAGPGPGGEFLFPTTTFTFIYSGGVIGIEGLFNFKTGPTDTSWRDPNGTFTIHSPEPASLALLGTGLLGLGFIRRRK